MLSEARCAVMVDGGLIGALTDARQAIGLCMQLSGYTAETLAGMLGLTKGYVSKCLSGRGNFPPHMRVRLMQICGNYAPLQYEAAQLGIEIRDDWKARRAEELKRELAALEAA